MAAPRAIGIGLLGLGVVGSGVARILTERADTYAARVGRALEIRRVLVRDPRKPRPVELPPGMLGTDPEAVLGDPAIALVIEVMGGEQPAYEYLCRALERGKYVVTANKEVMAKHGPELYELAARRGVDILFEASVGGGIPLIAPLQRDLLANEITSMRAIINGTTNYILTRMARDGTDYRAALRQAQQLGYAEPDPTNDVEGMDAAYKLAVLASLGFRMTVRPGDVYREGITRLHPREFRYAAELGYALKLLAIATRDDHRVLARVHPALIPAEEPLAKVDGVNNAVEVVGDLLGRAMFQGQGAGSMPTTSAVVADVIDAAFRIAHGGEGRPAWRADPDAQVCPMSELQTRYYLRLTVPDRAGVLARVTRVLGEQYQISIASIIQKEADETARTAEIVIMTHLASEGAAQAAVKSLEKLDVVRAVGALIRVEGQA